MFPFQKMLFCCRVNQPGVSVQTAIVSFEVGRGVDRATPSLAVITCSRQLRIRLPLLDRLEFLHSGND